MRPELVMKSIIPVVMAGVLGIYGLIIAVIISTGSEALSLLCYLHKDPHWDWPLLAPYLTLITLKDGTLVSTHRHSKMCLWLLAYSQPVLSVKSKIIPNVYFLPQSSSRCTCSEWRSNSKQSSKRPNKRTDSAFCTYVKTETARTWEWSRFFCAVTQTAAKPYYLFDGYAHLAAGLACGLAGLGAGMAIGIVGDAGVRWTFYFLRWNQ